MAPIPTKKDDTCSPLAKPRPPARRSRRQPHVAGMTHGTFRKRGSGLCPPLFPCICTLRTRVPFLPRHSSSQHSSIPAFFTRHSSIPAFQHSPNSSIPPILAFFTLHPSIPAFQHSSILQSSFQHSPKPLPHNPAALRQGNEHAENSQRIDWKKPRPHLQCDRLFLVA